MNMEKAFVPKKSDLEKLESIKSQRDSIKKILSQLDKEEMIIKGKTKQS